jgi:hypothetical protein
MFVAQNIADKGTFDPAFNNLEESIWKSRSLIVSSIEAQMMWMIVRASEERYSACGGSRCAATRIGMSTTSRMPILSSTGPM